MSYKFVTVSDLDAMHTFMGCFFMNRDTWQNKYGDDVDSFLYMVGDGALGAMDHCHDKQGGDNKNVFQHTKFIYIDLKPVGCVLQKMHLTIRILHLMNSCFSIIKLYNSNRYKEHLRHNYSTLFRKTADIKLLPC